MKEYIGRPYRIQAKFADAAEKKAREIRKKTGKDIRWTDIIREALAKYFGEKC